MAKRPTIRDVAAAAGVSVATVNRVVHGYSGVRAETGRRVSEAALRIGYHGSNLIQQRLKPDVPHVRLGVLLQKEKQDFYRNLGEILTRSAAGFLQANIELTLEYTHSPAPRDVAERLRDLGQRCEVIAATAVNHHEVTQAVNELKERGVECFALFSDFAQGVRLSYIGLNNLKVGRGTAKMLSVAAKRPGKIAIFVGGHRWHGHDLREAGFRSFFREHVPQFRVLDTLVNLETRQLTQEATLDLLARHRDTVGIYVAGGGMEGAIAALREEYKPGDVALVVNEVTPFSQAALEDGYLAMINETPLQALAERLFSLMVAAAGDAGAPVPGQVFLKPVLHLPEFD